MIRAFYHELGRAQRHHPAADRQRTRRGYAPAGQDIVCAGASILMQALVWMTAENEEVDCAASDGPEGPRISVTASPSRKREDSERLAGGFELAKAGADPAGRALRPTICVFADTSRRGEAGMVDLQLFARREEKERDRPAKGPALSRAQARQAAAAGTLHPQRGQEEAGAPAKPPERREKQARPPVEPMLGIGEAGRFIRSLHRRWALEEAEMRRGDPKFSFRRR